MDVDVDVDVDVDIWMRVISTSISRSTPCCGR
jgi:hypothetical protein